MQVKDVQIDDLYSIDTESLLSLAPVYGVIFLFKYGKVDREFAKNGNKPLDGDYDEDYQEKGIFFSNQTIQNACATQAVLNTLLNVKGIELGEELLNFKSFVAGFDGEMIGETVSNSELIRTVHNSFSSPSLMVIDNKPEQAPDYDNDGLFHFIGYVNVNNQIYELDGLKKYPIKHDKLESEDEFLFKLPEVLRRRVEKYGNEVRFSLLGITNNKINYAKQINDESLLLTELLKRETWKRDNKLRKHDYTGLIVELLKNINKSLSDEEYEELIAKARKEGQSRFIKSFMRQKAKK